MNQLVPFSPQPAMTVSDVERVALAIAKGGLFGSKDPNAVLTLCLLAQAEGQHPAVVFRDYHIISGKPAKKAEAMLRDFINAGGKVEWHQLDDECADATFTHPSGSARIEWTLDRARQAGISTAMWSKYPRQMLRSRVISEGIRTVYPGATSGLYEEGEVRAMTNTPAAEGETIEAQPVDEARREPAAREKLDGEHTSKTALRQAIHGIIAEVRKAETLEALDKLKHDHRRTINQALRDWPLLINGDPDIDEDIGLKGELDKRREELTPVEDSETFKQLIATLDGVESLQGLSGWMVQHGDAVGSLEGEESRRFEQIYDTRSGALKAVGQVSV